MDPSLGDRKTSLWRTEDPKGKKKKEKDAKKPHWLVAKEAGKRKNGSEKRRKRTETPAAPAAAPAPAPKKRKAAREEAIQLLSLGAEEQRSYLWHGLRERLAGVMEAREPPVTAFVTSPGQRDGATIGERVRAAALGAGEEVWSGAGMGGPQRRSARVLVLAAGAVRCVEIIASLRPLLPEGAPGVAKLWAKHMDVAEQKTHLATHYCGEKRAFVWVDRLTPIRQESAWGRPIEWQSCLKTRV
jgi:hypothetical protein